MVWYIVYMRKKSEGRKMIKSEVSTRKNNVIDLFSKRAAREERNSVDYSLLHQLQGKGHNKVVKHGKRNNLLVLFPSFCA